MNRTDFETAYRRLLAVKTPTSNVGCIACERCTGAIDSTFCADCKAVSRCQYCLACEACTDCVRCSRSQALFACSHCEDCEGCTRSAYLVRSVRCHECTYCFGCVGLTKRDFYILNEPHDRETYFKKTAELTRALGRP